MTFVPESLDRPMAWIDACSESLSIPKSEAASMFSRMCGFNSWDILRTAVGSIRPSLVDEKVSSSELVRRRKEYTAILVEDFQLHPSYANHIVDQMSPSSSERPVKFSIDTDRIYGESPDDSIDLNPFGLDDDDIVEHMKKILPKELSAELEGFTSEQIRDGMRMYHPIDPGLYYDLLGNLGFDLIEDSFIEEHTLAEPSFFFASEEYAAEDGVPCYLGKISVAPLDSTDDLANRILEDVSDDIEGNGYGVGVVLWKSPTFKDYKGGTLQYFGRLYSDGVWHELLLKPGVKSIDELIDVTLKGFDVNDPGIAFKWSNSEPIIIYHAIETESPTNKHLLDNFDIMQIRGVSGWTSTLCGPKK